jgi:uncharacterized protein YggE
MHHIHERNHILRHFLTAVLGILTFAAALRAGENDIPRVTVFGTATTKVTPDQMVWHVLACNKGARLSDVAEQHAKLVEQVLGFVKKHGIKDADVQTAQMEFGENWEYRSQSRVKEGYFASTRISFRTSDMAAYKPLWLGLAGIPDVTVEGVYYDHSKRIDYQNETRRKALLAAKAKAADMAKTVGSEIAEPLLIEEDLSVSDEGWRSVNTSNAVTAGFSAGGGEQEGLAPGTIPIRARLKVSFRLVSHGG